jgi:hypothetical protein
MKGSTRCTRKIREEVLTRASPARRGGRFGVEFPPEGDKGPFPGKKDLK